MHLIQVLLPLYDNDGRPIAAELYRGVAAELTGRFGGLTAYTRAPAQGLWTDGGAEPTRDDIVIYEVMADRLDRAWWRDYRARLEVDFRQEQVIVRAQVVELL
jgi:hypothetical protein